MGFFFFFHVGKKSIRPKMAKAEPGKPRNYKLESGVYRYSRSTMYGKKAIYKFVKKTSPKAAVAKKDAFVEKKIGGAKNGGTRLVRVKSLKADYPLVKKAAKGTSKNFFALNGCPLRRVNQRYLLATKTKLDIASVKVPENIDDAYFKRAKKAKAGKKEGDILSPRRRSTSLRNRE